MLLTTKGRYAVMAMADLAINSKGKPVVLADIAERQEVTLPYLEQIFAQIKANGLVNSVRGPGGGYLLSRSAEEITVAEIVQAVEEKIKMTRCNHDNAGCMSDKTRCLTHDLWDGLGEQIVSYLKSVSLNDVCKGEFKTRGSESDHKIDNCTLNSEFQTL